VLYTVRARLGDITLDLGRTGFRRIEVDRGADGKGFTLRVNGEMVFCRGAVWTSANIVNLPCTGMAYRSWLEQMRDACFNMVRVPGTSVYESKEFHDLCDELGILVWQDFMFANFDYPDHSPEFRETVAEEARQFLHRVQLSPSLAVLCGGSEVHQQAAMVGMPASKWSNTLFDKILPDVALALRPDVAYVANSPSGGDVPFSVGAGVAHYFGVGAYLRPLTDARQAKVRFASECLAFANIPQELTLEQALPVPAVHHPRWKERTPRDQDAAWDFEDVRDHYLESIYGLSARELRYADPERYAYASRAIVAHVVETTFAEWRRSGSPTCGALVWVLQDLWPGAGWGLIDSLGEPKSVWFALKRASQPLYIALTDEGLDGLAVQVINETPTDRKLRVKLSCLHEGRVPVVDSQVTIEARSRSCQRISAWALIGSYFDISHAYRFGPLAHEVTVASLHDALTGERFGEAFHTPHGYEPVRRELGLKASLTRDSQGAWDLEISTSRFAQAVHIFDRRFRAQDDFFHLSPLAPRHIRLLPRKGTIEQTYPEGQVMALNGSDLASFGVTP
jgi:beta-mannosidase